METATTIDVKPQLPKVFIPLMISTILEWLWRDHANMEWSVLGKVEDINGNLVITDIFIPKQKNQWARTEMQDPTNELIDHLIAEDKLDWVEKWKLWFHSHNKMSPFRSGQDNTTRKEMCSDNCYENNKWYWWSLSIVIGSDWGNPKYHGTVDYYIWEKWKWTQYSQDVKVCTGLCTEEFEASEDMVNKYIKRLLDEVPWVEIFNWIPESIASNMVKTYKESLESSIESKKQQYKKYYSELMKEQQDRELDAKLIEQWYMRDDLILETFVTDLKEKEKQPVTIFPPATNWLDRNQSKWNPIRSQKKKKGKKKGKKIAQSEDMSQDLCLEEINYKHLIWADWVFSAAISKYRNPADGIYYNFYEARKILFDSLDDVAPAPRTAKQVFGGDYDEFEDITISQIYQTHLINAWWKYLANINKYKHPTSWFCYPFLEAREIFRNSLWEEFEDEDYWYNNYPLSYIE